MPTRSMPQVMEGSPLKLLSRNSRIKVACHFFCKVDKVGLKLSSRGGILEEDLQHCVRQYLWDCEAGFRDLPLLLRKTYEQFREDWLDLLLKTMVKPQRKNGDERPPCR